MAEATSSPSASALLNTRSSSPRSCSEPTRSEIESAGGDRDHRQLRDAPALHQLDRLADLVGRLDDDQLRHLGPSLRLAAITSRTVGGRSPVEEAVLDHVGVVVELREVRAAAVGDQREHGRLGAQPGRHLQRGVDGGAARAADQQALLARHPAGGQERVAVGDGDELVDQREVHRRRAEVLADPLDQVGVDVVGLRVDRALGVGADDADRRVLLLQVAGDAGDGAAGAQRRSRPRRSRRRSAPRSPARWSRSGPAGWPGWRTGWA